MFGNLTISLRIPTNTKYIKLACTKWKAVTTLQSVKMLIGCLMRAFEVLVETEKKSKREGEFVFDELNRTFLA